MKTETLKNANKWFALHNINTFSIVDKMYIVVDGFEFELNKDEIKYREKLFLEYKHKTK
tara:strand:+ start:1809 stop:1985 length:177 start_codon:yes stop_codon:yes gene_type:complete